MTTAQAIQTSLAALLVGVALPLLVQMFLAVRAFSRSAARIERSLEEAASNLSQAAARVAAAPTAQPDLTTTLTAALVPAAVAAFRAFRAHGSHEDAHHKDAAHATDR